MQWFFPTWNGDFRLKKVDDERTDLLVVMPTEDERKVLDLLEKFAKKRGWCDDQVQLWPDASYRKSAKMSETRLAAPITDIAPHLVQKLKPGAQTLTAIRFHDDTVEVIEEEAMDPKALEKKLAKKPTAAATTKRPTSCCPTCYVDATGPATDSLLAFLTDEQHEQWAEARAIVVRGQLSGHRYIVAHRSSEIAAAGGRMCWDVDDQLPMHFHDNTVPAEEEALAVKLMLEHREQGCATRRARSGSFRAGSRGT